MFVDATKSRPRCVMTLLRAEAGWIRSVSVDVSPSEHVRPFGADELWVWRRGHQIVCRSRIWTLHGRASTMTKQNQERYPYPGLFFLHYSSKVKKQLEQGQKHVSFSFFSKSDCRCQSLEAKCHIFQASALTTPIAISKLSTAYSAGKIFFSFSLSLNWAAEMNSAKGASRI